MKNIKTGPTSLYSIHVLSNVFENLWFSIISSVWIPYFAVDVNNKTTMQQQLVHRDLTAVST